MISKKIIIGSVISGVVVASGFTVVAAVQGGTDPQTANGTPTVPTAEAQSFTPAPVTDLADKQPAAQLDSQDQPQNAEVPAEPTPSESPAPTETPQPRRVQVDSAPQPPLSIVPPSITDN